MINLPCPHLILRHDNVVNRYSFGILLTIALAATLTIVGVIGYEFLVWDDNRIIHELQSRSSSTGTIVTWLTNTTVTNLFTPVSLLFWGILADVFGIAPIPFHAAGVLLHLLNVFLVYLLIARLFSLMPAATNLPLIQPLAATAAAGLWGMHVLRAEVIGWVAATPYALSTALALLATHSFISSCKSSTPRIGIFISWTLYSFSVLAHPQTAPLCFVFLALDYLLSDQASSNTKTRLPIMYFVKRHAAFFIVGLLVLIIGMAVRSSVPSMPFNLMVGTFGHAFVELVKLLGFICDFALLHAWLPQHISNIYDGYEVTGLLAITLLASFLFFSAIVFLSIRRWAAGNKGLLLALLSHIAFCIPAAGVFMPQYLLADRYTYGLAIIASIVFAFTFRSAGEFVVSRLMSTLSARTLSISLASITLMLLMVCLSGLVAALHNWENTHTLMVQLQKTAPSQNWRYFAKLRDIDYLKIKGDVPQLQRAILSFLDAPQISEGEALVRAVQYLVLNSRCEEAHYLAVAVNTPSVLSNTSRLNIIFSNCL